MINLKFTQFSGRRMLIILNELVIGTANNTNLINYEKNSQVYMCVSVCVCVCVCVCLLSVCVCLCVSRELLRLNEGGHNYRKWKLELLMCVSVCMWRELLLRQSSSAPV